MAIIPRQIGWSQESNLLWQILRQMDQLTKVTSTSGGGIPSLTATQIAFGDGSNLMTSSANFTFGSTGANLLTISNGVNDPLSYGDYLGDGHQGIYNSNGDQIIADIDPTYSKYRYGNGKIFVEGSFVGINTPTPSVALDVFGDTQFDSATGNYIFLNVPTYSDNNAALAGGLVRGNIYQLGPRIFGDASHLAIVY